MGESEVLKDIAEARRWMGRFTRPLVEVTIPFTRIDPESGSIQPAMFCRVTLLPDPKVRRDVSPFSRWSERSSEKFPKLLR